MSLDDLSADVPSASEAATMDADTYLTFAIGSQIFAVDVGNVREILDMQPISELPNAPHDVVGMIDVRDQGIAIVNLASRLGMMLEDEAKGRIIVFEIECADGQVPLGVIADKVMDVAAINASEIEVPPATLSSWDPGIVRGVARQDGNIVILLHLSKIFDTGQIGDDIFDFEDCEDASAG